MPARRLALGLILLLAIASSASAQTRAVRFGRLWDGSKVITDAVVTVNGDRIIAIGAGNAAVPKGAEVIDLRKYTGLPGLIDLHTHITSRRVASLER
jgi:imidazolonepropionase-like amidohydrolase